MKYSLLDSSDQDVSNGGKSISLALIDKKLWAFWVLEFFNNSSLSIDAKNMILLPFDAPNYDESNKIYFIFLWSLDSRQMLFKFIAEIQFFWWFHKFWHSKVLRLCIVYLL